MLCDDIIAAENPRVWNRPFGVRNPTGDMKQWIISASHRVRNAERFALDSEALEVATHVGQSKPSSLVAGLGIARLPFSRVFIEFDWIARLKILMRDFGYADRR